MSWDSIFGSSLLSERIKREQECKATSKREGCEGHEVALPFDAEFIEAEKGLLKRSETRSSPTLSICEGTRPNDTFKHLNF